MDTPKQITILTSDTISVWCYPTLGIIHHKIHSYCCNEPFRQALSAGRDALIQYKATRWLSDDRENGPLSPDDEEWATKTWFPEVRAAGWTHWAMVMPHKVIGQMNIARFVKLYSDLGVTARIFSDPIKAFAWLSDPKA